MLKKKVSFFPSLSLIILGMLVLLKPSISCAFTSQYKWDTQIHNHAQIPEGTSAYDGIKREIKYKWTDDQPQPLMQVTECPKNTIKAMMKEEDDKYQRDHGRKPKKDLSFRPSPITKTEENCLTP